MNMFDPFLWQDTKRKFCFSQEIYIQILSSESQLPQVLKLVFKYVQAEISKTLSAKKGAYRWMAATGF